MNTRRSLDASAGVASDAVAEANHRIANNLADLATILIQQFRVIESGPETVPRELVGDLMLHMAGRMAALGRLHRLLSNPTTAGKVELGQLLAELVEGYRSTGMFGERLQVSLNVESLQVAAKDAWLLMQVIAEIATNAVKYAHPTGLPVELYVAAAPTVAGGLLLHVADDGVGLPEGFDEKRDAGRGLRVARALVEHAGGSLTISSSPLGLSYTIEFPAPQIH
jgi:two-component sensor histidine kinase